MSVLHDNVGASVKRRSGQAATLLAINTLYIGFGTVMGTVQGGLPPVLRQQGYDISSVGLIYAFYLPFGLAFLWAHYVDRVRLPFTAHRTGWIVAMQTISVASVVLIALGSGWPAGLLVALGMTVTFAMATMDTALDALAVEKIEPARRPLASGLKLAALSGGAMIGNGAFVVLFSRFGWQATFLFLAILMALLALPVLAIREGRTGMPGKIGAGNASLLKLFRDSVKRRRLLLVTLLSCAIFPLAGLNRIMLVDLGVPLEHIGWIVGTLGPVSMLAVSLIAMPLMAKAGVKATFLVFAVTGILCAALLAMANVFAHATLAIAASIIIGAAVSGIYVTLMAKILGWSAGDQPATDYAAYYGISRFSSTVLTMAAAQIAGILGWSSFFCLGALLLAVVTYIAGTRLFRRDN